MKRDSHGVLNFLRVGPGALVQLWKIHRVETQTSGERRELRPAREQFPVALALVAADVVRPEEGARVPRVRGKRDLELERRPENPGIAGEFDRVALAAPVGPAAEELTAEAVALERT